MEAYVARVSSGLPCRRDVAPAVNHVPKKLNTFYDVATMRQAAPQDGGLLGSLRHLLGTDAKR